MKNNQLSLRFNEEEFKALQEKALADGRTASAYAKEVILDDLGIVSTEEDLTLNEVHERAKKLNSEQTFSIPDLFTNEEWGAFSKASRLSIGRLFFNSTKENGQYHDYYRFVDKKSSNLAYYVRL